LVNARLFIDDTPGITTLRIKAKCRRLVAEHGKLDLVIVDYLQLVGNNPEGKKKSYNREQEVSQISKDFKSMAKELDVPLIVLSQLSRAPENRSDHRPQLSDLRESGSLEQDADVVEFIYREDKYKNPADHAATLTHVAELILAKQRNGPTGVAALRFEETTGRFSNLYQGQS
jgi:replicative DNA helicase